MAMSKMLADKTAIVTGGSRGVGAGIAKELARRGARVMITFVSSPDKAAEVVADIVREGGSAAMLQADCSERSSPQKVVHATLQAFSSGIDVVVNNAGSFDEAALKDITLEQYDQAFNVCTRFPIFLVQAALPYMPRGGKIINIGSQAARVGTSQDIYDLQKPPASMLKLQD